MELRQLAVGLRGASPHFCPQAGQVWLAHGPVWRQPGSPCCCLQAVVTALLEAPVPEPQPDAVPQLWGEKGLQRAAGSRAPLCSKRALLGPASYRRLLGACWRA